MLVLDEIKIYEDLDDGEVIKRALRKKRVDINDVLSVQILKKSIDSRDKKDVHYSYSVAIEVKDENKYPKLRHYELHPYQPVKVRRKSSLQPVIIGSGPAGLFCALTLVEHGFKPIIIEQGDCVEKRVEYVQQYRSTGQLNPKCNVQFGEGGAGTFSDGKLTTGINSPYIRHVLELFYRFGAPQEITYLAKPHIGTDNLVRILANIRSYIEENGGKYYFNTHFENFTEKDGLLEVICDKQRFVTDALVLAIGHSARDTFEMLKNKKMEMHRKNFSVGVRIEHLQKMIDESQYGTYTSLKLPPASYKLVYHGQGRSCYSFCMCPGGQVIASSSEENAVVTNGMSEFARDGINSNAALLVNVQADDFSGDDPLAGMYFQKQLEEKAYVMGGGNGFAPIQRVQDFLENRKSTQIGHIKPTYQPGYTLSNLNELFPDFVSQTIREALPYFDRKISGFNDPDAILTAVESRTSSPVTINRNDLMQSSIANIYPCGEGAGYAGGITSCAVDGIRVARAIMEKE